MTKIRTHMVHAMDLAPSVETMRSRKPKQQPSAYWRAKRSEIKARRIDKRTES